MNAWPYIFVGVEKSDSNRYLMLLTRPKNKQASRDMIRNSNYINMHDASTLFDIKRKAWMAVPNSKNNHATLYKLPIKLKKF